MNTIPTFWPPLRAAPAMCTLLRPSIAAFDAAAISLAVWFAVELVVVEVC